MQIIESQRPHQRFIWKRNVFNLIRPTAVSENSVTPVASVKQRKAESVATMLLLPARNNVRLRSAHHRTFRT